MDLGLRFVAVVESIPNCPYFSEVRHLKNKI